MRDLAQPFRRAVAAHAPFVLGVWAYARLLIASPVRNRSKSYFSRARGDWKLLVNTDGSGADLYNIGSSRFEFRNLAGDYPEITTRLSQMVRDWYAEVRH